MSYGCQGCQGTAGPLGCPLHGRTAVMPQFGAKPDNPSEPSDLERRIERVVIAIDERLTRIEHHLGLDR